MKTRLLINIIVYTQLACILLIGLSACGSSTSGNTSGGRGNPSSVPGTISIGITDAAVDDAQEVWIQFTGATVKPTNGNAIDFMFDSVKNINLLSLQGTFSTDLMNNAVVPLGSYEWIRLHVNANNDNIVDSYIKLDDGSIHELWIPSGDETGLKIVSGFELSAMDNIKLMVDFDLRKSVVLSNGTYKLRPTLRMVNMKDSGTITGTIDSSEVIAANCSDSDPTTGNAVYLFKGINAIPDDMRNGNHGPFTSANVELNVASGNYEYVIGYVPEGSYTLAFTCQADLDNPASNDDIIFRLQENVTVVADQASLTPGPVR
jgi:hypothetical protein